jgi:hypothetical protein
LIAAVDQHTALRANDTLKSVSNLAAKTLASPRTFAPPPPDKANSTLAQIQPLAASVNPPGEIRGGLCRPAILPRIHLRVVSYLDFATSAPRAGRLFI